MPQLRNSRTLQNQTAGITADWLLARLKQNGVALQEVCEALELPDSYLASKSGFLRLKPYNALYEWAAKRLDDEFLGIHMAEQMELSQVGMLGYLLINTSTLRDFCNLTERYLAIFQQGSALTYRVQGDICQCRYQVFTPDIPSMRQDVEFTLALGIVFFRQQLSTDWTPIKTYLSHEPPRDPSVHRALFGETIHYNYAFNGFDFDAQLLNTPVSGSDPQLLGVLQNQANQLLSQIEEKHDLVKHLRLLITSSINRESFGAAEAARELNMDRKTLHRHLASAGTSYKVLKNEVMVKIAKEALAETGASITDIALQLGYSEISAFVRAFKRLTGTTPLQYRKCNQLNSL